MWSDRPGPCRVPAGKGTGCSDRVREVAIPQPASALRPPTAASPRPACRAGQPHLSALLHAAGGQDAHRDADPWHAAVRELDQLALRTRTVNSTQARVRQTEIRWGRRRAHKHYILTKYKYYEYKQRLYEFKDLCVSVERSFSHISSVKLAGSQPTGKQTMNVYINVCSTC